MTPIPTKLTIAPLGYSWHGQKLQKDLDGLPCRPVCPTPAHQRPGDSLAAPAEAGQGAGSDMLRGELSHPIGFWVTCHDMLAFLPSDVVRQERRA